MNSRRILSNLVKKIHLVSSLSRKDDLISKFNSIEQPTVLSFVNAHAVNLCFKNNRFFEDLLDSDWLLRDGSGMKLAYSFWNKQPGLNMNGTDFIPEILECYSGKNCIIYGTKNPNLSLAAEKINALGVEVIDYENGFQQFHLYIEKAKQSRPSLILLGMGMPKQERLSILLKAELDYPVLIINGGAVLDFLSGKIRRSPLLFRLYGMEWLWRFALEPSRMWKRYIVGNVVFIFRLLSVPSFWLSTK